MITCGELAKGVDWGELWTIIKQAKKAGDPIANLIHKLDFEHNKIVLLLSDKLDPDVTSTMEKVGLAFQTLRLLSR